MKNLNTIITIITLLLISFLSFVTNSHLRMKSKSRSRTRSSMKSGSKSKLSAKKSFTISRVKTVFFENQTKFKESHPFLIQSRSQTMTNSESLLKSGLSSRAKAKSVALSKLRMKMKSKAKTRLRSKSRARARLSLYARSSRKVGKKGGNKKKKKNRLSKKTGKKRRGFGTKKGRNNMKYSKMRLKKDIKLLSKLENGLNIYSWTWNKLPKSSGHSGKSFDTLLKNIDKSSKGL